MKRVSIDSEDRSPVATSDGDASLLGAPAEVRVAAALGRDYRVERELGRGGTAIVFLATHLPTKARLAVKLLRPELARAVGESRFRREIRIIAELDHPHILPLTDVGGIGGDLYFTMPYVEGETLRARLARVTQLPLKEVVEIARQVAMALDYAHSRNIVHRDVKPANILLGGKGAIVADFGIARLMTTDSGDTVTDSGLAIGTPEYMSPEQGTGGKASARSDIYSLGCVVYEMLAGEPPFTGPTSQAIIARHCHEEPRSIRIIRPAVGQLMQAAVEQALAKVPADRFTTATAFVDALEAGMDARTDVFGITRLGQRARSIITAGLLTGIVTSAYIINIARGPNVDRNRVVVFPLNVTDPATAHVGEEIATFIGYRLAETRPLQWKDGWELLSPDQRARPGRLDPGDARDLSAAHGAGFYIDGSVLARGDSVTIALRLVDVAADSVVRTVVRSTASAGAAPHQLALDAVQVLLMDLVAPGGRIDPTQLGRNATAVAHFLQGERDYRRMRFRPAVEHYRSALREDSTFALAAMRGAYAASWMSEPGVARPFLTSALQRADQLPPAQLLVTRGLGAYLAGDADAAIDHLRRALRVDSTAHAVWTLLGEVYSRLLPNEWAADSIARQALERARIEDPDFSPTLLLLEEFALRDGNLERAARFAAELQGAGADTTHAVARRLMHACVADGPADVDWTAGGTATDIDLITTGKVLGGAAAQSACAVEAFLRLLASPTASLGARWNALVAFYAQLAATGRSDSADAILAERNIRTDQLRAPKLIHAVATRRYPSFARAYADSVAGNYVRAPTITLWIVGHMEADSGDTTRLASIAHVLRARADSMHGEVERRTERALTARLLTSRGDTAAAIAVLRSLRPGAGRREVIWYAWEALGLERLLLARLQLGQGQFEEARRTATLLDASEPLTYPFFLRPSLQLRAAAADSLPDATLRLRYRERLRRLSAR